MAGFIRHNKKQSGCHEDPEKAHESHDSSPGQYGEQKSERLREGSFSQVTGEIVNPQRPARFRAITPGQPGAKRVDAARSIQLQPATSPAHRPAKPVGNAMMRNPGCGN